MTLIKLVAHSLRLAIKDEIRQSSFAAILVDETSDFLCESRIFLAHRSVSDGTIKDRFIGLEDISENGAGATISTLILDINRRKTSSPNI